MIRNSMSLSLTALLFTVISISCRKESATPKEAFNQAPDAAVMKTETTLSAVDWAEFFGAIPVYDFINPSTGDRILTWDSTFSSPDWTLVGVSFRMSPYPDPHIGRIPIYEYYNAVAGDHAYSTLPDDPGILSYPNWQRNAPGPAFYATPDDDFGCVPVYSYYNAGTTTHLYSTDPDIMSKYPGWGQKFLAWYGWAPK